MILYLAIAVSVLLFINKVFILIGKKVGWLVGVLGCTLAVIYLFLLDLYVFTVLEVGLTILMGYGFLAGKNKNPKVEELLRGVIGITIIVMAYFAFSGILTIAELVASLTILLGTYFLTHDQKQLGWFLYVITGIVTAWIGYEKDQEFFANFQIASAIVAAIGMFQAKKINGRFFKWLLIR